MMVASHSNRISPNSNSEPIIQSNEYIFQNQDPNLNKRQKQSPPPVSVSPPTYNNEESQDGNSTAYKGDTFNRIKKHMQLNNIL